MRQRYRLVGAGTFASVVAVALSLMFTSMASAQSAPAPTFTFREPCSLATAGHASCHAIQRIQTSAKPKVNAPGGLNPVDLQSAYGLSATGGSGQTVAVVDAYDDPNAEADLTVYRAQFGLPVCTTANGCFSKVNQTGGTTYPAADTGWAEEIALDIDMVSAICPNCHILLVEATNNSDANLYAADDYASAHADWISNSWSGGETRTETSSDSHFNKAGKVFTFATGDSGYAAGPQYPATSPYVVAVGGTTLSRASNARGWTEAVWSGAGSGCSRYETRPAWQTAVANIKSVCAKRADADIAAIGNPSTGVSVYDSYRESGWLVFGGTSVATPIIAAVYALANNASTVGGNASYLYSHTANYWDVTSGNNGRCGTLLCTGHAGWDGPTGLGTPKGIAGF